jgi:hypothetical protein
VKLYLIRQHCAHGFDTFDRAVVAAEGEQAARETHPRGSRNLCVRDDRWYEPGENGVLGWFDDGAWTQHPSSVSVKLLGEAAPGIEAGMICASYHAG